MPGAPVAMTNFSALSSHGDHRGDGVGVDVEHRAVVVGRQRAHDRHEVVVELLDEDARVEPQDVADETVVDGLAGHLHGRALRRFDQAAVDAADADRRNAERAAHGHDARVDLAVQHHRRDFERLRVRDAPALDHLRRQSQAFRQRRRLRAAAVHDDDADADLVQDADLLHQRARALGSDERIAAGLQDEHFVLVDAQVRQRMAQRRDDDRAFVRVESVGHVVLALHHPVQHGHLRVQAVARFLESRRCAGRRESDR